MTPDELQRLAALKGREFLPAAREHADAMRKREAVASLAQIRAIYNRTRPLGEPLRANEVWRYCEAFKVCAKTGMDADTFARSMRAVVPIVCDIILDRIGMHPSGDPELAALQRLL